MPIKDPFGESSPLLSGSSSRQDDGDEGCLRLCFISWRLILLVILVCGIAMTFCDRTLLSIGAGPELKETPLAVSTSALLTFYAGCMLTSFPGGRLAEIYGGKLVMVYGVLVWAVANIALAFGGTHEAALIPLRGIAGLAQGVIFPATFHMISAWFPEGERTSSVAASLCGVDIGIYITMLNMPAFLPESEIDDSKNVETVVDGGGDDGFFSQLASTLVESAGDNDDDGGALGLSAWAVHSVVLGVIGLGWCATAGSLTSSTPEWHPRISLPEVQFITKGRKQSMALIHTAESSAAPYNWQLLLRHPALLTIYFTHAAASLVFYTTLLSFPVLCSSGFGLSITAVAPYMTLPCAASVTASLLGGFLCDRAIASGRASRRDVRVRATTLGLLAPALALPAVKLCAPNAPLALGVLTLAAAGAGVGPKAGWLANVLDLAPNHAGLVTGIASAAEIAAAICVTGVVAWCGGAAAETISGWAWAVCSGLILCAVCAVFSVGCSDDALVL